MTKQQRVLRTVGTFLRLQSMGYPTTPAESKTMGDLCFLSLPMKHRLSEEDLVLMNAQVAAAQQKQLEEQLKTVGTVVREFRKLGEEQ